MKSFPTRNDGKLAVAAAGFLLLVAAIGLRPWGIISRPQGAVAPSPAGKRQVGPDFYSKRQIGTAPEGQPWITDLLVVDLDGSGRKGVLVAEGRLNKVTWIRQVKLGVFLEEDIGQPIAGPAHLEVADLSGTGHLDILVAAMGVIPPDNEKVGSVVALQNDGKNHFTNRVLLDHVARVTYLAAAHLTHSGLLDLVVGQFGYLEGEIRWIENLGDGNFKSHPRWTCRAPSTLRSRTSWETGSRTSSPWSPIIPRRSTRSGGTGKETSATRCCTGPPTWTSGSAACASRT
jgi:hypothetical protein